MPAKHIIALLLATLLGLSSIAMARSAQIEPQPNPSGHMWQRAQTPPGAVSWETLAATEEKQRTINGFDMIVPVFTPQVRALDGKTITINGYMAPVDKSRLQKHFILMAYPPSCPFCLTAGPANLIDVRAPKGVRMTNDSVLLTGKLVLLESDPDGFFFRLENAAPAKPGR